MSIICFKEFEDKIQVAFDGRCISNSDTIECENYVKAYKVSESLIIAVTGFADTVEMFKNFVECNKLVFEKMTSKLEAIPMMIRFKQALLDQYGFTEESIKDLGGFLIANKQYHSVFYYDDKSLRPYPTKEENDIFAFGSTATYTAALMDAGIPLEDAIKKSAEKYTSVNSNVTIIEISK